MRHCTPTYTLHTLGISSGGKPHLWGEKVFVRAIQGCTGWTISPSNTMSPPPPNPHITSLPPPPPQLLQHYNTHTRSPPPPPEPVKVTQGSVRVTTEVREVTTEVREVTTEVREVTTEVREVTTEVTRCGDVVLVVDRLDQGDAKGVVSHIIQSGCGREQPETLY